MVRSVVAGCVVLIGAAWFTAAQEKRAPGVSSHTVTKDGIRMDVQMESVEDQTAASFHEGEDVRIRLRIRDNSAGTPVTGANPAAWVDRTTAGPTAPAQCIDKIRRYYEGSTFNHAELDLTSHYVAVLNGDASISVVDPRFGFGDSRLIAMIELPSPGDDWAIDATDEAIYVSLPATHQVAVIDTAAWKVKALVSAGTSPRSLALQPDGAYLWVADDSAGEDSGVLAIRTSDFTVVARVRTGLGSHQLAITPNSSFLFVSNAAGGSVSVVDTRKLAKTKDLPAGKTPGAIAYSALAQALYVTSEPDGIVSVFDGKGFEPMAKLTVEPGVGHLKFTPNGRFALALNSKTDKLYVFDASTNHLVQTAHMEKAPNQIAFSNKLVFVRHAGSDTVLMVPLDSLGQSGAISTADFTGGNHAPGKMRRPTHADGIVQASGEDAVLVANPGDRAVYFYMEGMAAPMGNFANYGKEPAAVMVVERNLRERKPGDYETVARLPAAGRFAIAFFVNTPRIAQCVEFNVEKKADEAASRQLPKVEALLPFSPLRPGSPVDVRFRFLDAHTGKPIENLTDVVILLIGPGGVWQSRQLAPHAGAGIYGAEFQPSVAGEYSVYVAAAEEGLEFRPYGTVKVEE